MTESWVSVEEVVKHFGVARDSVYRWIEADGLPAKRVGRLWDSKLSEVDAWVSGGGAGESTEGPTRRAAVDWRRQEVQERQSQCLSQFT